MKSSLQKERRLRLCTVSSRKTCGLAHVKARMDMCRAFADWVWGYDPIGEWEEPFVSTAYAA